jgi:hypothetical protein
VLRDVDPFAFGRSDGIFAECEAISRDCECAESRGARFSDLTLYHLVRIHETLSTIPTKAHGVRDQLWSVTESICGTRLQRHQEFVVLGA